MGKNDQIIPNIEAEKLIAEIAPPAEEQRAKSVEDRIAERLGDTADKAQIKAIADEIRKDLEGEAAAAMARLKARQAKGRKF